MDWVTLWASSALSLVALAQIPSAVSNRVGLLVLPYHYLPTLHVQVPLVWLPASDNSTSRSILAWCRSTYAQKTFASSTSKSKLAPSDGKWSSRGTTSTSKCAFLSLTSSSRTPSSHHPSTSHSDSVIYFQITSPYRAAFGITDLPQALIERAQTTLRHVVGARAVQSVVTEREAIAFEIAEIVGDVADKWGVAIEGILIKDIIFSAEVSASLSSAAQQKRIGESKVIAARAEVDSARLMRQAADILASPAAMQIRQLEALQQMAKTANTKVVFVPMNLQSDVIGQMTQQPSSSMGESSDNGVARVGLLTATSDV